MPGHISPNVSPVDDMAAQLKRLQQRLASLERASTSGAGAPTDVTASTLRLTGTGEVTPTSTTHPFQIGSTAGANVASDSDEIQARTNGAVSPLHLNPHGGDVVRNGKRLGLGLIAALDAPNWSGNCDAVTSVATVNYNQVSGNAYQVVANLFLTSTDDFPQVVTEVLLDGGAVASSYTGPCGHPVGQYRSLTGIWVAPATGVRAANLRLMNFWSSGGTQTAQSIRLHVIDLGQY